MSAEIPVASSLASVTLDRGLYVATGIVTTIAGVLAALPLVALSHALRLYASLFVVTLIAFLMVTLFAVAKALAAAFVERPHHQPCPSLKNWMEKRYLLVQSVESALFDFHHKTPGAFCASFSLNLAAQCLAVSEVCLILWLMGVRMGFFSALIIEALTKLVNVLGNFNPGNIGTYEGGTMLIGKMFGLSSPTGLALGLSRRLRSFFWAAVGLICFVLLTRSRRHRGSKIFASTTATVATSPRARANSSSNRSPETKSCSPFSSPKERPGAVNSAPHSLESARYRSFSERYCSAKGRGNTHHGGGRPHHQEKSAACVILYRPTSQICRVDRGCRWRFSFRTIMPLSIRRPANDWS